MLALRKLSLNAPIFSGLVILLIALFFRVIDIFNAGHDRAAPLCRSGCATCRERLADLADRADRRITSVWPLQAPGGLPIAVLRGKHNHAVMQS